MIDPIAAIIAAMSQPSVVAVAGTRIWVGPDLPVGYDPTDGAAILFTLRGGGFDYTRKILTASCYVRLYSPTSGACIDLWRTCADAWLDTSDGTTRIMPDSQALPRLLREQATLWLFALSGWTFHLKNY